MPDQPRLEDVRVVDFAATPVAVLTHRGDPALLDATIARFIAWRRAAGLPPRTSRTFNLWHADPATAAPADFRLDLCASTQGPVAPNDAGVVAGLIPAGRCAVLRQSGGSEALRAAAQLLRAQWLPRSGARPRDYPLFVERVRFAPEVPADEAITDIYLPLEP